MKHFLIALLGFATTAHASCDWSKVNHDRKGSRYNPCEKSISRSNVGTLHVVDQILLDNPAHTTAVQTAPIVVDHIMYFGDMLGRVYAVNVHNFSDVKWTVDLGAAVDAPITAHGNTLYVATNDIKLHALDIATGNEKANFPIVVDPNNTVGADILAAPVVADGIVIVPTCDGAPPPFGTDANPSRHQSISAFDAVTGALKWRKVVQPAPLGAQGGSLCTSAIDKDLKLMYIGTSNADTKPVGKHADALLALDYRTGKLKWHYQFTKDDAWGALYPNDPDADLIAGPTLLHTYVKGGKKVAAVAAFSKKGDLKVFDRKTGRGLWKLDLVPKGYNFISFSGPGSAFDPYNNLLYVPTLIDNTLLPTEYQSLTILSSNGNTEAAARVAGVSFGSALTQVSAVDVRTHKVKWKQTVPIVISGSLAAANGVIYLSNWAGHVFALDGKTGDILLDTTVPAGFSTFLGGAPIITNGRLLIPSGIGNFPPLGPGGIVGFGL